ncbi:MAG: hypothetical protein AAF250_10750 [Pseudomonadota bacterium]
MSYSRARERARDLIFSGEGYSPHMYLDTVSVVTIGYGTALQEVREVDPVELFVIKTGKAATAAEKATEWKRVQAISPRGADINRTAKSYARGAVLRITHTEAVRQFNKDLDEYADSLRVSYPRFDLFPEDAQVAMLDMVYNLGPGFPKTWTKFTAAVNRPENKGGPDWRTAAAQSNRYQLSAMRNHEVKALFLRAAQIAEAGRRKKGKR